MPIIKWSAIKQMEAFLSAFRENVRTRCFVFFVSYGTSSPTGHFVSHKTSGPTGCFVSYRTSGPSRRFVSYGTNGPTGRFVSFVSYRTGGPTGRFVSYRTSGPMGRFDNRVHVLWLHFKQIRERILLKPNALEENSSETECVEREFF